MFPTRVSNFGICILSQETKSLDDSKKTIAEYQCKNSWVTQVFFLLSVWVDIDIVPTFSWKPTLVEIKVNVSDTALPWKLSNIQMNSPQYIPEKYKRQ